MSVPRKTATGISDATNETSGKSLLKTKMGRCTDRIQALPSQKVGGLANYISYTPALENGVPVLNEKGQPMMMQEYFEIKYNKPKGFFTNEIAKPGTKEEDLTYFQTKDWILNDGTTVLDMGTMDGELGYYVMLDSHQVANSEKEWREHKWPRAQWYIALENESDAIKYKKNEIKSLAFAALHSSEFVLPYKRKFVVLLNLASSKAALTDEQVVNLLYDYIDKSTFTPGSNIDKFNELYRLLSLPDGREKIEARYLLAQAIDYRVVNEKQDIYTWIRPKGSIELGSRYSEAVEFILNPKKSTEVEELIQEIKLKQG